MLVFRQTSKRIIQSYNDHATAQRDNDNASDNDNAMPQSDYGQVYDEDNREVNTPPVHHITLHRGQVMKEMIDAFKRINDPQDKIIKPQLIMPNGELEAAEDAGGVTRDILTEF